MTTFKAVFCVFAVSILIAGCGRDKVSWGDDSPDAGSCDCPDCPDCPSCPGCPDSGSGDCPDCPDGGPCDCPDAGSDDSDGGLPDDLDAGPDDLDSGLPDDLDAGSDDPDSGVESDCETHDDCDDGDPCTTDECSPNGGECNYYDVPGCCTLHKHCQDGDLCNGEEVCNQASNTCHSGTAVCPGQLCEEVGDSYICVDCLSNDDCGSDAPICLDGECVECVDDEDCPVGDPDIRCHWGCNSDNICVYIS